jgi:hypothetical protein
MTINGFISGPGYLTDAVLYRDNTGELNADTFFKYLSAGSDWNELTLKDVAGDTMFHAGGSVPYVSINMLQYIVGRLGVYDTLDFTLVRSKHKVQFPDKGGTVAFISDVTSQTVAQVDTAGLTVAATLRVYTTLSVGTFQVGGYINITAVATDVIELRVKWTDENSHPQYAAIGADPATIGFSVSSPIYIRAKSGTLITVYDSLITGGGTITYDAGVILKLDHI